VEISYAGDDYHNANATTPAKFSIKKVIENISRFYGSFLQNEPP